MLVCYPYETHYYSNIAKQFAIIKIHETVKAKKKKVFSQDIAVMPSIRFLVHDFYCPFMNSKRDFYAVGEAFHDDMAQYDKWGWGGNHFMCVIICQPP